MPKAAVVLSGCGFLDGAEIHEAVSVLLHLSRLGIAYDCFAPDTRLDVVDHLARKPTGEKRSVLAESARIARGRIDSLANLDAASYDAVLFPGGFGAAKNLCTFASHGADCRVDPQVERVLRAFHKAGKPIGLCCIAPVLAAKVLGTGAGGPGVSVTLGDDPGVAGAVAKMGATHVARPVTEAHVDRANKIATAPAYMYEATPHEVYVGIGKMVEAAWAMR